MAAVVIALSATLGCSHGCSKSGRTEVPAGIADGVIHTHGGAKPTDPITMTLTPRERAPIAPGSPNGNPGAELLVESAGGGLAMDDRDLYWFGRDVLWRLPKGTHTSAGRSISAQGQLAINDDGLFFWTAKGAIQRVGKYAGAASTVVPSAPFARFLVDDKRVYWTDGRAIFAAEVGGGEAQQLVAADEQSHDPTLLVDVVSGSLYFTRGSSVEKVSTRGGNLEILATAGAVITGARVRDDEILFVAGDTASVPRLQRVPTSGGAPQPLVRDDTCIVGAGPEGIDADRDYAYYGCFDGGAAYVSRVALSSSPSPATKIAILTRGCDASYLRVDRDAVYFIESCRDGGGVGPVYRVPKSGVAYPVDALKLTGPPPRSPRGAPPGSAGQFASESPCSFRERCNGTVRERCKQTAVGAYVERFQCEAPNGACVVDRDRAACVHEPVRQCTGFDGYCDASGWFVVCDTPEVGWTYEHYEVGRECPPGKQCIVKGTRPECVAP